MNADLLARLIAVGTPADLVAEVAVALSDAGADQRALARRRRHDADRQAERRERLKSDASRDITRPNVKSHGKADKSPAPNKSPQTPKINPTPPMCEGAHAREAAIPGHRMSSTVSAMLLAYLAALDQRREAALIALWHGTPPPPNVSADVWSGFLAHRRSHPKAGKFTPRAYQLLCEKLRVLAEDGWPPGAMLDRAIEHGWITVWPPKDEYHDRKSSGRRRFRNGRFRDPLLNVDPEDLD